MQRQLDLFAPASTPIGFDRAFAGLVRRGPRIALMFRPAWSADY